MHATILHIETSTNVCSIALSEGTNMLFTKSDDKGMNHAALLSLFIEEALQLLKSESKKLDAVAVSSGPGSYTGLRIGTSTAKGLCYGLDIPLIAVDTLEVLSQPAIKMVNEPDSLFCPMIDARRMEVYAAFYMADNSIFREVSADIITDESYLDILDNNLVYFFGNGAEKCKGVITHRNARFIDNLVPSAENMASLSLDKFNKNLVEDTAYFEPFYLKEFQATTPKKII